VQLTPLRYSFDPLWTFPAVQAADEEDGTEALELAEDY
jgi:hypothetical protein